MERNGKPARRPPSRKQLYAADFIAKTLGIRKPSEYTTAAYWSFVDRYYATAKDVDLIVRELGIEPPVEKTAEALTAFVGTYRQAAANVARRVEYIRSGQEAKDRERAAAHQAYLSGVHGMYRRQVADTAKPHATDPSWARFEGLEGGRDVWD